MMNYRRLVVVAIVPVLMLVGSCGGNGDDDTAIERQPTMMPESSLPDETALAESMLLTVADFPSGWAENPSEDDDDEDPFEDCPTLRGSAQITGQAETGDFTRGSFAEVSQIVAVFVDDQAASDGISVIEDSAECRVDIINDGGLDNSDATYGDAKLGRVSFSGGDFEQSEAFRLTVTARAREDDSEAELFLDFIYERKGRVVSYLGGIDLLTPIDVSLMEELSTVAARKVAAANVQPLEE